ncbi:MAG: hypothetical protein M3008_07680 [Chloroflexota bacterium]|nr:hypothetical protein [Chloroflexota bacterium]
MSEDSPDDAAGSGKPIRLRPSQNHKRRSKLNQQLDETTPPPPPPPVEPSVTPARETFDESLLRRMRLKRSGHMHDDLMPVDEPAPERKPEDEY